MNNNDLEKMSKEEKELIRVYSEYMPENTKYIVMSNEDYYRNFKEPLEEENKQLQNKLQQKENIIKEVREKIENTTINCDGVAEDLLDDILEILEKGE